MKPELELSAYSGRKTIYTERLKIRVLREDDAKDMFEVMGDPKVVESLLRDVAGSSDELKTLYVPGMMDGSDRQFLNLGLEPHDGGGKVIGSVSVRLDEHNRSCRIGYALNPMFWGKGYATEAVRSVVDYLFEEVKVNRIEADHFENNTRSKNVLLKCGFVYEGLRREEAYAKGRFYSLKKYAMLRDDWISGREGPAGENEAIRIAEARAEDSGEVLRLMGILGPIGEVSFPFVREALGENKFDGRERIALLAWFGGHAVGMAQASMIYPLYREKGIELNAVVTDPKFRRMGVARRLLCEVEQWAVLSGASHIVLRSAEGRAGAHAFYIREGYTLLNNSAVFQKRLTNK